MTYIREIDGKWYAFAANPDNCLLYTSDAADEEDSVNLGCSRINKKKTQQKKKNDSQEKKRSNHPQLTNFLHTLSGIMKHTLH